MAEEVWKSRVRQALAEKGLNMKEASLAAGKGETFVRDMLERHREPKIDNFTALARVVDKPISYLLGEDAPVMPPRVREVKVRAFVQAGAWSESWEWDDDDRYPVYIPTDPRFEGLNLYAAETRGPSMNKRYPERTVLVFTKITDTREHPVPGKRYIVERRRPSGESEHTVKLLHRDEEGRYWLIPESDDPRFQAPIPIDGGETNADQVIIIGRIVYAISEE